ncbi:DUF4189 domain-containing protein [Roseiarcaceae bacterium H3SJ34-1]|uniref:DUF4189 domain-containing protein n=1 Tax=Terripilifer ovatus TaxID=3032367 RepID=UPI003AB98543|nr:DUF4189 domain-containing protein [Roseiarcaceae bacterium H3SJ34-1]
MKRQIALLSAVILAALAVSAQAQTSPPAPAAEAPAPAQNAAEIAFWNSVKDSKNPAELRAYLQSFPAGIFAQLARVRIEEMEKQRAAPAPAPTPQPGPQTAAFDMSDPAMIRELQNKLYNLNYKVPRRDGVFDNGTREAINDWQKTTNQPVTGTLSADQWRRLREARLSTTWGAIAYTARGAFGQTFNRASREDAEQEALRECRRRAGRNADCRLLAGMDASCVAMASYRTENRRRIYFGSSVVLRPQLADAISEALRQCNDQPESDRGCSARTTFCANGSHRR